MGQTFEKRGVKEHHQCLLRTWILHHPSQGCSLVYKESPTCRWLSLKRPQSEWMAIWEPKRRRTGTVMCRVHLITFHLPRSRAIRTRSFATFCKTLAFSTFFLDLASQWVHSQRINSNMAPQTKLWHFTLTIDDSELQFIPIQLISHYMFNRPSSHTARRVDIPPIVSGQAYPLLKLTDAPSFLFSNEGITRTNAQETFMYLAFVRG